MSKVIHRFWAGPRPLPETYIEYGKKWIELNPEMVLVDWTEDVIDDIRSDLPSVGDVIDHLYERDAGRHGIELFVQLADIVGYYLPWKYGGYYFNMDMEPVRPFYEDMPEKAWASYENNEDGRIVNAAVGAPEDGNSFWEIILRELPENYWQNPYDEMVMSTGPGYLTRQANKHFDKIHVFPTHTFNPVHWKQIPVGGDASGMSYPAGTIATHHWGHKKDQRSNIIETATQ